MPWLIPSIIASQSAVHIVVKEGPLVLLTYYTDLFYSENVNQLDQIYTVSQKNILDVFSYNSRKH